MSTDLRTIAQSSVRVRFKEPLLSEAVNRAQYARPRGVHRGFNLTTSGSALTVTVEVDPATGDSVAVVHDITSRALTIRESAAFTLDLSAFASKTVAIALYAIHVSQGTTIGVVRGYEIDPSDELTGDPDEGNLIVLGTVVVPASGTIAAASITHQRRVLAANNVFAQAERYPLVYNHDFAQAYESSGYVTASSTANEAGLLWLANRWVARGTSGSPTESTGYLADGTGLTIRSDGSGDYDIAISQDIGTPIGDLSSLVGDWHFELEVVYDVLSVQAGATCSVACIAVAQGAPTRDWSFSTSLDLSATGTDLVAALNADMPTKLDTLAAVALSAGGTAVLSSVQISGTLSGGTATTAVLKIKSIQGWVCRNTRTGGYQDPDARIDSPLLPASLLRMAAFAPHGAATATAPQWRHSFNPQAFPRLLASSDNPRFGTETLLQLRDAVFGTQAPITVEGWLSGANRADPRFKAEFDESNALTTLWEAVGDGLTEPAIRCIVSSGGLLYLTANAMPSGADWAKDDTAEVSIALVVNNTNDRIEIKRRAAGAGTWTEAQWVTTILGSQIDIKDRLALFAIKNHTLIANPGFVAKIAFQNGVYVGVEINGSTDVDVSEDGENYSAGGSLNNAANTFRAENGKFLAISEINALFDTSTNGTSWTSLSGFNGDTDGNELYILAWSGTAYVVGAPDFASSDDFLICRTTDGITGVDSTIDGGYGAGGSDSFNLCIHDGTNFIAAGTSTEIQTSADDGATFTHRDPDASYAGTWQALASGGGVVMLLGSGNEIQTSTDSGVTWVQQTIAATSETVNDIGYDFQTGRWFLFGTNGLIQSSLDGGVTWEIINHKKVGSLSKPAFGADSAIFFSGATIRQSLGYFAI